MHAELPFLSDLLIIISCSLPVVLLFRRLKLPPIAGFIATGVAIGPFGLGFISQAAHVDTASEFGIVLLLFMVGLEFSLSRLLTTPVRLYLIAALQVVLTTAATALAMVWFDQSPSTALIVGFIVALSSSAIVLKGLSDKGELETPAGRLVVTACIVQDLAVVPMLVLTNYISGDPASASIGVTIANIAALSGALFLLAKYVLPRLLKWFISGSSGESTLLATVLVVLGIAWLTSLAGLSLALGAFAAGLVLSETEFYPQIFAEIAPFRSLFASIFFVSVGMMLDLHFLVRHWPAVLLCTLTVLSLKTLIVALSALPFGIPTRIALQSGLYLAQIGEFAFLFLASTAAAVLSEMGTQYIIAVAVITMTVTPLLLQAAPRFAHHASARLRLLGANQTDLDDRSAASRQRPAVLIIGYGLNGRNVARVLSETGIYYEILESNPEIVRRARKQDQIIHYGDSSRGEVLAQIAAQEFDSVVIAISDLAATRHTVALLRSHNPHARIIVRTRYISEVDELKNLGADSVVPEEFETSLRIFSELLNYYHIPPHIIAAQVDLVRRQEYGLLRTGHREASMENIELFLAQRLVEAVPLSAQSAAIAKTVSQCNLLPPADCVALSVIRDGKPLAGDLANLTLQANDLVVLFGSHAAVDQAIRDLSPP